MRIIARENGVYRIVCQDGHVFRAATHSLSVECPSCGRTETTSSLVDRLVGAEAPAPGRVFR